MATGFIGKQGGWRNRQISLNNMQKIEFTESQGFWNNYAPKREVNEKFGQYFFSNGRRITFGTKTYFFCLNSWIKYSRDVSLSILATP